MTMRRGGSSALDVTSIASLKTPHFNVLAEYTESRESRKHWRPSALFIRAIFTEYALSAHFF